MCWHCLLCHVPTKQRCRDHTIHYKALSWCNASQRLNSQSLLYLSLSSRCQSALSAEDRGVLAAAGAELCTNPAGGLDQEWSPWHFLASMTLLFIVKRLSIDCSLTKQFQKSRMALQSREDFSGCLFRSGLILRSFMGEVLCASQTSCLNTIQPVLYAILKML